MAPVPAIGDDAGGTVGVYLKRLIARRGANEQTRLLYVAATRAKKTLYLSAAPKTKQDGTVLPRAGTLLASLWPALGSAFKTGERPKAVNAWTAASAADDEWAIPSGDGASELNASGRSGSDPGASGHGASGASTSGPGAPGPGASGSMAARSLPPASHTNVDPTTPPTTNPIHRLAATWVPPLFDVPTPNLTRLPVGHQSLEPPEFSWVGETGRHIGTVVHAALESFANAPVLPTRARLADDRDTYTHQLRRHGVPDRDLPRATDRVLEALTGTVSDERGRWIFSPDHREARSELALTSIAAGRLTQVIIDRSFVDREGTRWVIDFKTSRHEGGGLDAFLTQELERYRSQLETYVALARGLGPNPVRAGLYFPLIGVFREL